MKKLNRVVLLLCTFLFVTACQQEESNNEVAVESVSESERLNQWFDVKYEERLQMNPMSLTAMGRKDKYDQLGDFTEAEQLKQLEWMKQSVDELKANFEYSKLDKETKTSYDIWMYQYERAVESNKFKDSGYVFTQMHGIQSRLAQFMINFHKVEDESDAQAYNKRISGAAKAISDLLDIAKQRASQGVRPPRFAYDAVIREAQNLISGAPFEEGDNSPLWSDINKKIDQLVGKSIITAEQAEQLKEEGKAALLNDFKPSYENLINWFKKDIDSTSELAHGVGSLPNGKAFYNHRLNASTTTSLTADEIHQIGLNEVARLTEEMMAIKERVGFEGDLKAFFKFIKTDERFFYPNDDSGRQAYIDDSKAYLDFLNQKLPDYFGILPKARLEVKRVEAFREQPGAAQHYSRGTPDGKRPGVYYAHLIDMTSMPKNEMEAIAYHEGNPGHHMQISIAQELTGIPKFRTQAGFSVYSEGWGLYSELLAKEMGAYQNDYSDFGRLITEMWRAVRLVVDTGMHAKGWSEEQAVQFFFEHTPIAEGAVRSEVRRYLVWPGQATSYKIGMLKILELRANAEKTLGDKFNIADFHDTILGGGPMPMNILESRVQDWIESVNSAL